MYTQNNYTLGDPVLLVKGNIKLAIYGVGYINDARFFQALQLKKVLFNTPKTETGEIDGDWHHILVIH